MVALEKRRDTSYVKGWQRSVIEQRDTKVGDVHPSLGVTFRSDVALEPDLITLDAAAVSHTCFQQEGLEFIYMLSGQLLNRHATRAIH